MSGNFVIYLIGYLIAIAGVAYALVAAGLGQEWVIAAVLILVGLGIVYALSRSQTTPGSTPPSRTADPDDVPRHAERRTPPGESSAERRTPPGEPHTESRH